MTIKKYWLAALAGAVLVINATATLAHDDDDDDDDHGYRHHRYERRVEREYYHYDYRPREVIVERPVVYQAPPPVVYQAAPPPVVYQPAPVYERGGYDDGGMASIFFGTALGTYLGHVAGSHR